jgi:SAM-dependent methyltransferase
VSFDVEPDAYDRFMGRYSGPLAPRFVDFARLSEGQRVIDVGCGTGALTEELLRRLGTASVAAVDPSEPFVAAVRARHPEISVQRAAAEHLPFDDGAFDAALAQLVVHFMDDAVEGLREMARVTREDSVVAACVWDHAGARGPLGVFWEAACALDPELEDESWLAGAREGHLVHLFEAAGLRDVEDRELSVTIEHPTFGEWWTPFTLGVGPAGHHVASLDYHARARLRERCREELPPEPFALTAIAWAARGLA